MMTTAKSDSWLNTTTQSLSGYEFQFRLALMHFPYYSGEKLLAIGSKKIPLSEFIFTVNSWVEECCLHAWMSLFVAFVFKRSSISGRPNFKQAIWVLTFTVRTKRKWETLTWNVSFHLCAAWIYAFLLASLTFLNYASVNWNPGPPAPGT